MRGDFFVVGTAAVAVVCCLGVSLLAAAGATTLLGIAGLGVPAALIGVGGWIAWYLARRRPGGKTR